MAVTTLARRMPWALKGAYKWAFPAPVELLSVHVPKTAGSSFQAVLRQVYGDAVYLDYTARMNRPTGLRRDWVYGQQRSLAAVPRTARAIHGHWPLLGYARRFPTAARIVWLRHPVDRLVSHYYYWRQPDQGSDHPLRLRLLAEDLSLTDFARLPEMRDVVSRHYLDGFELADLAFVGISESFDTEVERLAKTLGWPAVVPARVNRTTNPDYRPDELSPSVRREIEALNRADMDLYRRAEELAFGG